MRLPKGAHESHPWRIREIAPDFRLEDAWALPAQGGADGFATLIEVMGSLDPTATPSRISRALFEIRFRLGRLLGWDVPAPQLPIPDRKETTLKDRLPRDLRNTTAGLKLGSAASDKLGVNFAPLYVTDLESAAEISNRTMHGVVHLSWVNQGRGRYQGQMAVYVKPRGLFGEAYMAMIRPFRYLIVYPALMRQIEAAWKAQPKRMNPESPLRRHSLGAAENKAAACPVPSAVRNLLDPEAFDYSDAFALRVPAGDQRSVEAWARAMFTPSGPLLKSFAAVWGVVTGVKPPTTGRRLSYFRLTTPQLGATVLEADGSRYHVYLVVFLAQDRVTFATFAKSRSAFWRYVLKAIMVAHRRVAPRLMERAIALKPTTDD